MNFKKIALLILCIIVFPHSAHAIESDGTLDVSFNPGSGVSSGINNLHILSNGKIIIAGDSTSYNGTAIGRIARLESTGILDSSFSAGFGPNRAIVDSVIQSDGKILIVGDFTSYNGSAFVRIGRINSDGSADTSFTSSIGANDDIFAVALQDDGKILIGGSFTTYNGVTVNRIARLNTDGTLDTEFISGVGVDNDIYDIALQDDGKILVGGKFSSYNGTSTQGVARLNTDGTLDESFSVSLNANPTINRLAIRDNGKILISGGFIFIGDSNADFFTQLNSDGTRDTAFDANTHTNGIPFVMIPLSNGKTLIGGNFTTYGGVATYGSTSINRIARLNTDGTLDTSFDVGIGVTGSYVSSTALQDDGKILIGGSFTAYNGVTRNSIARISYASMTVSTPDLQTAFDSGFSSSDDITNNTQPTFEVSCTNDIVVTFYVDDQENNEVVCNNQLATSSPTTSLSDGMHTIKALYTDLDLSTSTESEYLVFMIDTIPPAYFTISAFTEGNSSVVGTGENLSHVTLTDITCDNYPVTVYGGAWGCENPQPSPLKDDVIYAIDTDSAGNETYASTTVLEVPRSSGGGGGGGGGSSSGGSITKTVQSTVGDNSKYTPTPCAPYLTGYIKIGANNDAEQVKKLQTFLNTYSGAKLVVDGIYKQSDVEAVNVFQINNRKDVLDFWNVAQPTGFVYVSTQKAINRVYCEQTMKIACPYFGVPSADQNQVSAIEIVKIRNFLNKTQGENISLTDTTYTTSLKDAIKRFQTKFASKILTPWSLTQPTGLWYQSTRKYADEVLGCFYPTRLDNGAVLP